MIAFNEKLTPNVIISIIIIFISVLLSNVKIGKKSTPEEIEISIEPDNDTTWIAETHISEKFAERMAKQE